MTQGSNGNFAKLLHTADLHLDSPLTTTALRQDGLRAAVETATRTTLERIVDIAIEEKVAAVLISGDLYDGGQRSMKTVAYLLSALRRLQKADIRVFIIRGNHDAESTITREIAWPDNVHVFDGRGGHVMLSDRIAIHGVSFRDPHAPASLLPKFRPVQGAVNVGMLHTSLAGAVGHDPYAPCSVADLAAAGFDYWALGHIHRRAVHRDAPFIVMPGMPQGRDMGEDGPKSVTLITVSDAGLTIDERPSASLEFRREVIDVSPYDDAQSVHDAIAAHVRNVGRSTPSVVRLTLTGQSPLNWQLRRDQDLLKAIAEESAATLGSVWIDRLEIDTLAPSGADSSDTASDEMALLIAAAARGPGFSAEVSDILSEVLADLPAEIRDHWGADEAATEDVVARLIEDASSWATARMHGAGTS